MSETIKEWMYSKWMIQECNDGYVIVYEGRHNIIAEVPFQVDDHVCDMQLARHIVDLQNDKLRKAKVIK